MSDLHFIDTNILMYAVGTPHAYKNSCLEILRRASEGQIAIATDVEVFQEVAYRYWHQRIFQKAVEVLNQFQILFDEIFPVEKEHLKAYYKLLEKYPALSPRDAIHIAVMQQNGVKKIYTTDRDFQAVPGIIALEP